MKKPYAAIFKLSGLITELEYCYYDKTLIHMPFPGNLYRTTD